MNNRIIFDRVISCIDQAFINLEPFMKSAGLERGKNFNFYLYNTAFESSKYTEELNAVRHDVDSLMVTYSEFFTNGDPNQIIQQVRNRIFMSFEKLYSLVLDCEMDFNRVTECLTFVLRHEFGHVLDMQRFIGQNIDIVDDLEKENTMDLGIRGRKNMSLKNRLNAQIRYHEEKPAEKRANEIAGITRENIIKFFENTHLTEIRSKKRPWR